MEPGRLTLDAAALESIVRILADRHPLALREAVALHDAQVARAELAAARARIKELEGGADETDRP